jgi:hypothetical protein
MHATNTTPSTTTTRRNRIGIRAAAGAGAMLFMLSTLAAGSAGAKATSKPISGHFDTQLANTPGCASPVGLCAVGEMSGALSGTLELTVQSITPSADPDVAFVSSTSVLHTKDGDIYFRDSATANMSPTGEGEFSSLDRIVGGTGKYAGASGYMRGSGFLVDGRDFGTYEGKVVLP